MEIMDGLLYGIINNRTEFRKNLENLHFERSRNNEDWKNSLVLTE